MKIGEIEVTDTRLVIGSPAEIIAGSKEIDDTSLADERAAAAAKCFTRQSILNGVYEVHEDGDAIRIVPKP